MSEQMKIGASYNRASDQDEAEKERGTLGNQEFLGEEVADQRSRETGIKHVIQYVLTEEDGRSGGNTDRPKYQYLWDLIEARRIDFVVAKEISRLNRSIKDFCELMEHCKRNGVAVYIKGLNIQFDGPMGELVYKLLALIAEFERKLIIQRTREGIRAGMLKHGKIHGGKVLLGFDKVEGQAGVWVPNAEELKQVDRILDIIPMHDRSLAACKAINSEGIKTKYGQEFTPDALRRLVLSKKYEGLLEVNVADGDPDPRTKKQKRKKVGEVRLFAPVVELEKLERARAQLAKWEQRKHRVRKRTYLLAGLLKHQDGSPFQGWSGTAKNGGKHFYYYNKKHKISLPAEKLENQIIEAIGCYKNDDEIKEYVSAATDQLKSNISILDKQIAVQRSRLKDIQSKEEELLTAFLNKEKSERTAKWLDERLAEFEKEREAIQQGIAGLDRERQVLAETRPDPKNLKATLEFVFQNFRKAEPSIQRNFMNQVFEKIVVLNKHEVQAHWRFPEITNPLPPRDSGGNGFVYDQNWGDFRELNNFMSL